MPPAWRQPQQQARRSGTRRSQRPQPTTALLVLLVLLLICSPIPSFGFLLAMASSAPTSGMGLSDIGGGGAAAQQPQSSCPSTSTPLWVQDLEAALEKNKADMHSRFLQLATVRLHEDGSYRPHVRWAVFRGFLEGTSTITIVTDARSEKVKDLQANPHTELAWYFVASREQVRIEGTVRVVTQAAEDAGALAAARRQAWKSMSDAARLQFAWPDPGAPQPSGGVDPAVFLSPNPPPPKGDEPPPDTFVLLVVDPSRVDHLQLRASPQIRRIHTKQDGEVGDWTTVAVNP